MLRTHYSDERSVLPMIPTAKYPSKAKMKSIQQRISVQPLRKEKRKGKQVQHVAIKVCYIQPTAKDHQ